MSRKIVKTSRAPEPIGPYSQAVIGGDYVFLSGQIAIDPQNGQIVEGGIEEQTQQVLRNLRAVLEEAGVNMESVVKTTIFLQSMDDFPDVNKIYGDYFGKSVPARSTVEVSRLPKNVLIEIECIALKS
jgi:2-iminobutanoate/2-iminopropanoate deaminase